MFYPMHNTFPGTDDSVFPLQLRQTSRFPSLWQINRNTLLKINWYHFIISDLSKHMMKCTICDLNVHLKDVSPYVINSRNLSISEPF